MPSRCWDPQDTLYLPVELLVKSKACPSFLALSQGHLCRGPAGFKGQVLGFLPGTGGYKEAQQVPRMPAGCQDVFWVSGISARLWDVHRDWNDWDVRWGFPEVPAAQEYGDAGRCSQVPRCLSVPVPGCRGALVPPRGLSPPGASGLAGAEGDTGPWHPRAAAPLGAPDRALHLPLLPYAAPPWPVLPVFASFAAPQRLRVAVLFLLERAGAFRKGLSEQLVSQRMPPDPPTGRAGGLSSSSGRQRAQQESLCPH